MKSPPETADIAYRQDGLWSSFFDCSVVLEGFLWRDGGILRDERKTFVLPRAVGPRGLGLRKKYPS